MNRWERWAVARVAGGGGEVGVVRVWIMELRRMYG